MIINVTQKDIDGGLVCVCSRCPVALATMRAFNSPHVEVRGTIQVLTKQGEVVFQSSMIEDTMPTAHEFIERFDGGLDVSPFSFEIVGIVE